MGFFKWWKKEKKLEKRLEEINEGILLEPDKKDAKKVEQYVLEQLEQIIEVNRGIEEEKSEYRIVTAYLNDIFVIENLPEKERAAIEDVARNIVQIEKARQEFLHAEKKISDVQYTQIQQEETKIPAAIKRLKANEEYQAILNKDMKYLTRERDEWLFHKEQLLEDQRKMRSGIYIVMILGILTAVALLFVQTFTKDSMGLAWTVFLFVITLAVCILSLKIMNAQKDYRRASVNADRAIQLLNKVKLKYVSVTNAIDYSHEKYHVISAGDFNRVWEAYLEAVKQREKFEINNDDLRYYSNRLVRMLKEYHLYDAKVWIPQAIALADHNEMVEVTHGLNERRQKIRARIENSMGILKQHMEEIEKISADLQPELAAKVKEVMHSIEK